MLKEGLFDDPPLFQLCMGIPWGALPDTSTMKAMVDNLPPGAHWAGFGIGRMQRCRWLRRDAAQRPRARRAGRHIWLDRGVHARATVRLCSVRWKSSNGSAHAC